MKQIINGKKYDTDTAKEIAHYCAPGSVQDFSYFEETLYRKKTGEYFLYGKGGPASRYSRSCGQTSGRVISGSSPLPSMRLVRGQNAASTPMSMRRSSERLKNNYSSPAAHNAPLVSKRRRFVDSHAF